VTDLLRYRGDTAPVLATLTKADGSPYDLQGCSLKLTCTTHENPPALFTTLRASGTLGAGTDTNTAAAVGKFADAIAGDLFQNSTRGLFAYVTTVTSDDAVELDRLIALQASGDTFNTGVSSQVFQIVATIVSAPGGTASFPFTAAEADFVGTYWFDVQLTDSSGKVFTLMKGRIFYQQDITK
jgi:hypothetical protein